MGSHMAPELSRTSLRHLPMGLLWRTCPAQARAAGPGRQPPGSCTDLSLRTSPCLLLGVLGGCSARAPNSHDMVIWGPRGHSVLQELIQFVTETQIYVTTLKGF